MFFCDYSLAENLHEINIKEKIIVKIQYFL